MAEVKFYRYIIAGLLVLNFAMLGFFFFHKPPHPTHRPVHGGKLKSKFAVRMAILLDLDDKQRIDFRNLARAHNQQMNEWDSLQLTLLPAYFDQLTNAAGSNISNQAILDQVATYERQKVEYTYKHFQALKNLLREDQVGQFEKFMKETTQKIYNKRASLKKKE